MTEVDAHEVVIDNKYDNMSNEDVHKLIQDIYDDFESRTCENCKHYTKMENNTRCLVNWISIGENSYNWIVSHDFGCNKWEAKQ